MKALLFIAIPALFLLGCLGQDPHPGTTWSGGSPQQAQQDPREDGWRACLLDRPVCVQAVYCDEESASEWPECNQVADLSCHAFPVPAGAECLDVNVASGVGHCDGKGACR